MTMSDATSRSAQDRLDDRVALIDAVCTWLKTQGLVAAAAALHQGRNRFLLVLAHEAAREDPVLPSYVVANDHGEYVGTLAFEKGRELEDCLCVNSANRIEHAYVFTDRALAELVAEMWVGHVLPTVKLPACDHHYELARTCTECGHVDRDSQENERRPRMTGPIRADQVGAPELPDAVFEAFNEMIVAKLRGLTAVFGQDDVIDRIRTRLPDVTRQQIFDRGWLDVEAHYSAAGWDVAYEKPGIGDDFQAHFTFVKKSVMR